MSRFARWLVASFLMLHLSVFALSNERVFAFAEANYPALFAGAPQEGWYGAYHYRYYPQTGNYLGIDTSGLIALLGPATNDEISNVGPKLSFEPSITAWEASKVAAGVCSVAAESQFGVLRTAYSLCYRRLPAGTGCDADGVGRPVADYLAFGPGYTHTASYSSDAACQGNSTVIDLGGDLAGAWRRVRPTLITSGNQLSDVIWDGSRYLVTTSNAIAYSSNGINWTQASAPITGIGELLGLAQGAGVRVAVGRGSAGVSALMVSDNGTSWTRIIPPAGTSGSLLRVIWARDRFVAVGGSQTILSSPDGRNWTRHAAPTGSVLQGNIVDVAWNGREFLAVGSDTLGFEHRSSDGVNWTTSRTGAGVLPTAIAWDGARWLRAHTAGATRVISTSTDGSTWTPRNLVTIYDINRLAVVGPRLLAIGGGGIFISEDKGGSWTEIRHGALRSLSATDGRGIACTGTQCLIVGNSGMIYSTY